MRIVFMYMCMYRRRDHCAMKEILDFIFIAVLCVCARVHFIFRYIIIFNVRNSSV